MSFYTSYIIRLILTIFGDSKIVGTDVFCNFHKSNNSVGVNFLTPHEEYIECIGCDL